MKSTLHIYGATGHTITGKQRIKPNVPRTEPEKSNAGKMSTDELKKLQADANRRGILLPTSFNHKIQ